MTFEAATQNGSLVVEKLPLELVLRLGFFHVWVSVNLRTGWKVEQREGSWKESEEM